MAYFFTQYTKKIAKNSKKNLLLSFNVKKSKKLFLFELVRQFFSIQKRNQRIWLKVLCNTAIKVATGEVTMCNFDENLEKFKF